MSIVEIQLNSTGDRENSYRYSYLKYNYKLKAKLTAIFPEALNNTKYIEMVSIGKKDSISYLDDAVVLVFKGKPTKELLKEYNVDTNKFSNLQDYYAIKYYLNLRTSVLKIYDNDVNSYVLPDLPEESILAHSKFGIGRNFPKDSNMVKLLDYRDIYFFHGDKSNDFIPRYFQLDIFNNPESSNLYLYGVTYDKSSEEVLKLKRYIYPDDPNLNYPEKL